jgi:hypothetical protein
MIKGATRRRRILVRLWLLLGAAFAILILMSSSQGPPSRPELFALISMAVPLTVVHLLLLHDSWVRAGGEPFMRRVAVVFIGFLTFAAILAIVGLFRLMF